ncbi:MAG: hypothetical protein K1X94_28725 [Sandaracinaceae bacterium]|nr:hypothetical protein [Sandaracinaceae bacterium]
MSRMLCVLWVSMRSAGRSLVIAGALAIAGLIAVGPATPVSADPPELEARVRALGPAREGEAELYAQLGRALETAEAAAGEGESARAERHRDLALALVRGLEARRSEADLRARLAARQAELDAARARLARAREASAQASTDAARVEGTNATPAPETR